MALVRSIGRWAMTALVINCIIGGGIFGLPSELTRLLGRASPFAMIFAALANARPASEGLAAAVQNFSIIHMFASSSLAATAMV